VAIKVTETTWHALLLLYFKANLLFLYMSTPSGATGRYTFKKLFVHERGSQRFWCWVSSWRIRVVLHFDGLL